LIEHFCCILKVFFFSYSTIGQVLYSSTPFSSVFCHLLPATFIKFHLEERWSMDVQTNRDISRTVEDRG